MDSTLIAISVGMVLDPLAAIVSRYPSASAAMGTIAAVVILAEQVWPHAPIKANSTLQVIINIARAILKKKG